MSLGKNATLVVIHGFILGCRELRSGGQLMNAWRTIWTKGFWQAAIHRWLEANVCIPARCFLGGSLQSVPVPVQL